MKRLTLAGLVVLSLALSRAGARADQDDAYGSLVGMAVSAASDRGPEAGAVPPDAPAMEESLSAASSAAAAPAYAPPRAEAPAKRAAPRREREKPGRDGDAPSVAVPEAPAPRVWTRVFSSLIPPARRAEAFEVAASTASVGPRPEADRPATPASAAGSAQGLLELVAAATAPSLKP